MGNFEKAVCGSLREMCSSCLRQIAKFEVALQLHLAGVNNLFLSSFIAFQRSHELFSLSVDIVKPIAHSILAIPPSNYMNVGGGRAVER